MVFYDVLGAGLTGSSNRCPVGSRDPANARCDRPPGLAGSPAFRYTGPMTVPGSSTVFLGITTIPSRTTQS